MNWVATYSAGGGHRNVMSSHRWRWQARLASLLHKEAGPEVMTMTQYTAHEAAAWRAEESAITGRFRTGHLTADVHIHDAEATP